MTTPKNITQDDLHAYVDGFLPPEDIERVETWLADHPEDAATVHAYRLQNRKILQSYGSDSNEDIPSELLDIVTSQTKTAQTPSLPWTRMAASVLLLLVGGISGWLLNDLQKIKEENINQMAFVNHAVGAHRVFVSEIRHPVEVPASQEKHLVTWLSKRIGTQLTVPDLQNTGFQLIGGRLLADVSLPAAQFMYENTQGERLTLYVRSSDEEADTAFRFARDNGATAFYWIDNKFAYAMVAPLEKPELLPIANKVYQDLSDP